jgi:hypothetical protein
LAALGFAHTYRCRYGRLHQIMADYAAAALSLIGFSSAALGLVDAYGQLRNRDRHDRSPAEQKFADWVVAKSGPQDRAAGFDLDRPSEIVAQACDLLETGAL